MSYNVCFLVFLSCLLLLGVTFATNMEQTTIVIDVTRQIGEIDENFVCATLDWWPPEKCNYDQCPWGYASLINLNLSSPLLAKAIEGLCNIYHKPYSHSNRLYAETSLDCCLAFKTLRIRIGGSLQDQVIYDVGDLKTPCTQFKKSDDGLFGFSEGCLYMERWDELNRFFHATGAIVTFGLNALYGREKLRGNAWGGEWDHTNTQGYAIDSWEFGNELSGSGIGASVSVELYGNDLIVLKDVIKNVYKSSRTKPLLLAPGGFYEEKWYSELFRLSGPGVLDVMTHHIYNLGPGNDPKLVSRILDPKYLSGSVTGLFKNVERTVQENGPWASAWVGEAGGAFNSGGREVSETFINSFCALLWHRLMGKGVLGIQTNASEYLRTYVHCSKGRLSSQAGITILLINLSKQTTFTVGVSNGVKVVLQAESTKRRSFLETIKSKVSWVGKKASDGYLNREEYHLSPKDGDLRSKIMMLNGNPLEPTVTGDIPKLEPVRYSVKSPLYINPLTISFIVLPTFDAPACS
uniref:Heparanase-like protein 2 n=1 Tax=Brassica oleracea var. oleracea TaxID=109376 RepID=A0A0D3DDJ4_BRAOL